MLGVVQHFRLQMFVVRVDLKECFTQHGLIHRYRDDFAVVLPDADAADCIFVEIWVSICVLPDGLEPVAVAVVRLVERVQEVADGWEVGVSGAGAHQWQT